MLTVGEFRSAPRPLRDADASVTGYLPVDSPFGSAGWSQVTLTIKGDADKNLIYSFEADGTAVRATP